MLGLSSTISRPARRLKPTVLLGVREGYEHPAINFSRSSGGDAFDSSDDLKNYGVDEWRHNYNRDTGIYEGRYIEDQATRLNTQFSSLSSDEDVTVDNVQHTISFWGSGSVTLSGAHSETINGADSVTRTTVTFTPSAGTLTISPSGTVEFLQLEEGSGATSPIAGDGQQTTRDPDIATVTDLDAINFNPDEGTFVVEVTPTDVSDNYIFDLNDGTSDNRVLLKFQDGDIRIVTFNNGSPLLNTKPASVSANQTHKIALGLKDQAIAISLNGNIVLDDTSTDMPTSLSTLDIGKSYQDSSLLNGFMRQFLNYPRRPSNANLQALTS